MSQLACIQCGTLALNAYPIVVVAQVVVSTPNGMNIQLFLRKSWKSCLGGLKSWDA